MTNSLFHQHRDDVQVCFDVYRCVSQEGREWWFRAITEGECERLLILSGGQSRGVSTAASSVPRPSRTLWGWCPAERQAEEGADSGALATRYAGGRRLSSRTRHPVSAWPKVITRNPSRPSLSCALGNTPAEMIVRLVDAGKVPIEAAELHGEFVEAHCVWRLKWPVHRRAERGGEMPTRARGHREANFGLAYGPALWR